MALDESSSAEHEPVIWSSRDRIKELNAIDQDIVRLLRAAGLAINSLTPLAPSSPTAPRGPDTFDARRKTFSASTAEYFRLLDAISVRLRRQIFALEEADILPADLDAALAGPSTAGAGASGAPPGAPPGVATTGMTAESMDNFDVGWLNSRRDVIGRTMEAELWAQARSRLETRDRPHERDALEAMQGVEVAPTASTGDDS